MEIDAEKFKSVITSVLNNLRELETELMSYATFIHLMIVTGLIPPKIPWKESVEAGKRNPVIVKLMADKYDPMLDQLLKLVDSADLQTRIVELLKQWTPSGPVN